MKSQRYILSVLILLIMATAGGAASGPEITGYQSGGLTVDKSYSYHTSLLNEYFQPAKEQKPRNIVIHYSISFDYVFKWRLSILMGEPVVIGWVAYKPTYIRTPLGIASSGINVGIGRETLLKKVHLTEFKMKVHMFIQPPGQRAFDHGATVVIDAGAPGKPYFGHSSEELTKKGKLFSEFASFNVSGSPDWSELFININDERQAKKYFTNLSNAARKRDRYYASYYKHEIVRFDVDTNAVERYINKYLSRLEKEIRDKDKAKRQKEKKSRKKQADALDAMLSETETPAESSDNLLDELEQEKRQQEEAANNTPSDSLEDIFSDQEFRDTQKRANEYLDKKLEPLEQEYQNQLLKCDAGRPEKRAFDCGAPLSLLIFHYDDPAKQREYDRQREEGERWWAEECRRRKIKWENEMAEFPQRLARWKEGNEECRQKAKSQYDEGVEAIKRDIQSLTDLLTTD